MTTQNQNPQATNPNPAENNPANPAEVDPMKQTGDGAPGDGAGNEPANGTDPAAQAAAEKAAADKAAADKAAADKAAAEAADKAVADRAKVQMEAAVASWKSTVKADPELGGDKYDATMIDIEAGIKAMSRPKSDGLSKLLESSGLKHHPDLAYVFALAGRMVKEGKITNGQAPQEKPKTLAERLYKNTK